MPGQASDVQLFSVDAQVVEVVEEAGRQFVKLVFDAPIVVDVTDRRPFELHLGDRVAVHGWFGMEREVV